MTQGEHTVVGTKKVLLPYLAKPPASEDKRQGQASRERQFGLQSGEGPQDSARLLERLDCPSVSGKGIRWRMGERAIQEKEGLSKRGKGCTRQGRPTSSSPPTFPVPGSLVARARVAGGIICWALLKRRLLQLPAPRSLGAVRGDQHPVASEGIVPTVRVMVKAERSHGLSVCS